MVDCRPLLDRISVIGGQRHGLAQCFGRFVHTTYCAQDLAQSLVPIWFIWGRFDSEGKINQSVFKIAD
jgi:hypothetical protein